MIPLFGKGRMGIIGGEGSIQFSLQKAYLEFYHKNWKGSVGWRVHWPVFIDKKKHLDLKGILGDSTDHVPNLVLPVDFSKKYEYIHLYNLGNFLY
jgi:hypothetical protein